MSTTPTPPAPKLLLNPALLGLKPKLPAPGMPVPPQAQPVQSPAPTVPTSEQVLKEKPVQDDPFETPLDTPVVPTTPVPQDPIQSNPQSVENELAAQAPETIMQVQPPVQLKAKRGSISVTRFAYAYKQGLALADCMRMAGSHASKRSNLEAEGSKFLRKPSVQAVLEELGASEKLVLQDATRRGLAKLVKIITKKNFNPKEITPDHAIAAMRLLAQWSGKLEEKPQVVVNNVLPRMSHLAPDQIIDVPGTSSPVPSTPQPTPPVSVDRQLPS